MIQGLPNRATQPTGELEQIRLARQEIGDLFERRAGLYWLDFLVTVSLSWTLTAVYFLAPAWSSVQLLSLVLAAVGFFRAGTFIHEIIHFKRDEMQGFKWAWNLLLGFPLLMPWVMYSNHIEHHNRAHFGTPRDGEYLPLAATPFSETLKYLAQIVLLPPLTVLRFGILGPLSHLHDGFREWLLTRVSAAVSNPYYRKRFPKNRERELARSEWFCFGWLVLLLTATLIGPMAGVHWLMAWALLSLAAGLNWLRNLAAHGYANRGEPLSHLEQMGDSYNIVGQPWLTAWFFPVGLKYHALHHLFPGIPYHALPEAHRRLMERLPDDHPYRSVNGDYFSVVGRLIRGSRSQQSRREVLSRWQTGR